MIIDHIALYAENLEGMRNFFTTYFKAQSNNGYYNQNTGFRSYFLTFKDGTRLEIMNRPELKAQHSSPYALGYHHIAFCVGSKDNVIDLTKKLSCAGYEILSEPRVTGDGYFESVIKGFEGLVLEITAYHFEFLKPLPHSPSQEADNQPISKEFYKSLFPDKQYNGTNIYGKIVKGDTLISFNTVAGCLIRLLPIYNTLKEMPENQYERLNIILQGCNEILNDPNYEQQWKVYENIKEEFNTFLYMRTHTLANFMRIPDGFNWQRMKGGNKFHDFPDAYFKHLQIEYFDENGKAKTRNAYFQAFGEWKNYVESNYLQPFFEDENYTELKQLAPQTDLPYTYNKTKYTYLDTTKEGSAQQISERINQIHTFLKNANSIIEERAKLLESKQML